MTLSKMKRPSWRRATALLAILFGLLTIISGGSVLFNAQVRQIAGNYVEFVVWFNFLAGFAYVIAGVGVWKQQQWSVWLSILIAGATLLTFAAFGLYMLRGGVYEMRTVGAMTLRAAVWIVIAAIAYRWIVAAPRP